MGPLLEHLKAGQRLDGIPAGAWNSFVDSARYIQWLKKRLGANPGSPGAQSTIVSVKNNSGTDRDRFDVLAIDDWFPSPTENANQFKTGPLLHGITPAVGTHDGRFVILLEPAASGKIVSAAVGGVTVGKVDVQVGQESETQAEIKNANCGSLITNPSGTARILHRETGTGIRWALLRLGDPALALAPSPIKHNLYKVIRESDDSQQFTITGTDPGTWNLYSIPPGAGSESDSYVTRLTPSEYGDPCLELTQAGLWQFLLHHDISVGTESPDAAEYTTAQTSEVSGHYHDYLKFIKPKLWDIVTKIEFQNGGSGEYSSIGPSAHSTVARWHDTNDILGVADMIVQLGNFDAGTKVRIETFRNGYNITTAGTFFVSGQITCRWMRSKTA